MNLKRLFTAGVGFLAGVGAAAVPEYRPLESLHLVDKPYAVLPNIGATGTGGFASPSFYAKKLGYESVNVEIVRPHAEAPPPFAQLMTTVRDGFGRTMSRLPEAFGVSRQTLYNWIKGEVPRQEHQARIRELAAAATVFAQLGFKPTSNSLDRSLLQGKSFLELLHTGADGREIAQKLVRVERRGEESRNKLDELLGGRTVRPNREDLGTPSLKEDA